MANKPDDFRLIQGRTRLDQAELLVKQGKLLAARLERLTPDSAWARRASGCRGTIIRLIRALEGKHIPTRPPASRSENDQADLEAFQRVLQQGFAILHAAARESFQNAKGQI